jgi:hypothetical protein
VCLPGVSSAGNTTELRGVVDGWTTEPSGVFGRGGVDGRGTATTSSRERSQSSSGCESVELMERAERERLRESDMRKRRGGGSGR